MSRVEVDQVECVVRLNASVDDILLVVGGVCVGVKSNGGNKITVTKRGPNHLIDEDEQVLETIRKYQPIDSRGICDSLGLSPKDPKRTGVRTRIRRLLSEGVIGRFHEDKHKSHARWIIS